MTYIKTSNLNIKRNLYEFIVNEVIPGTGLTPKLVFDGLSHLIYSLSDANDNLLNKRSEKQGMIDAWHRKRKNGFSFDEYQSFLKNIDYLLDEPADFCIGTANVDHEVATIAGPQLVVPVKNARYAINASNARWGSLYDALYGTDVIEQKNGLEIDKRYNPQRGESVIHQAKTFLDDIIPLEEGSHHEVIRYYFGNGSCRAALENGEVTTLYDERLFAGYIGEPLAPSEILFLHNGLHISLVINKEDDIGHADKANLSDILLESAVTTIQDCEDSVVAVDSEDKVEVYRNWLGLMQGDLTADFTKAGKVTSRVLAKDRFYTDSVGNNIHLKGRSLLMVRNVGLLMKTDMVLDEFDNEVPEGLIDGFITTLAGLHDLQSTQIDKNSRKGSIYIVKPKLHGPEEVAFTCRSFELIEQALGLAINTIKLGLMDEERRTSINLKACIYEARQRIVFVNTGFLDRTGDEIHTSMEAGAVVPKTEMKHSAWINAYEKRNVSIALECGFHRKAQIGKGMWAMPDRMADMLMQKIEHPKSGASTAWVPSPTAATLHAIHYHKVDVFDEQKRVLQHKDIESMESLLSIPLLTKSLDVKDVNKEIDNNIQGILGYVSRWIDQGIGCSKVPDINDIGLMEDRATLRISSQHLCNWIHHGICSKQDVLDSIRRMAKVVDQQNLSDPEYAPLQPDCGDISNRHALAAAWDLIIHGKEVVNGYTEPALHRRRKDQKDNALQNVA